MTLNDCSRRKGSASRQNGIVSLGYLVLILTGERQMSRIAAVMASIVMLAGLPGCHRGNEKSGGAGTDQIQGKVATTLDEALAAARAQNKPILLVAYRGDPTSVDQMILSEPSV